VPASIVRYRLSVGDGADDSDGADDIDGVKVFVVGGNEVEGSDDGVDDHDEVKGSQIGFKTSLLNPFIFILK